MSDLFDDAEGRFDEVVDQGVAVSGEGLLDAVDDHGAEAEAGVAKQSAEAVDARSLHFEVGNTMGPIGEAGEPVDEFRLAQAEAQHTALGTVETGAGNGDALVET